MYAKVTSLGVTGLAGYIVQVEADLSGGLPQFNLVGLPDSAVKESMLIKVFGAAVQGIDATLITIEVNSSRGCMFYLVGLPDSAVKESHQRIISALQVNGYRIPTSNIVINMAPADIRKEGSAYDLPLAIGMLAAGEVIQSDKLNRYLMMGELSLDGSLQPIKF